VPRTLALAMAAALGSSALPAAAIEPEISSFGIVREDDGIYLNYVVAFDLSRSVEDALNRAVPLFFVAEAEILRDRWYWTSERVAQTVRTWRLVYQPLTSTYRVTDGGLSQTDGLREEALAAVSRSSRWKIADLAQIGDGQGLHVQFTYRLDTSLMPRPMQIGVAGQPEWALSLKRTQRLP
jgi:hypothetical protein